MSGHRVGLRISFTVGDENGRAEAEGVVQHLESMADHGELDRYTGDFTVTRGTVNGNPWYGSRASIPAIGRRTRRSRSADPLLRMISLARRALAAAIMATGSWNAKTANSLSGLQS